MRNLLVGAEVALATVALVGSGLFVRSFRNIRAIHPGFDAKQVLLGRFFIETAGFDTEQVEAVLGEVEGSAAGDAGVEAMSYSDFVPIEHDGVSLQQRAGGRVCAGAG